MPADPKWRGQPDRRLAIGLRAERPNDLVIVLTGTFLRPYRGRQKEFVAVAKPTGKGWQTLSPAPEGCPLKKALAGRANASQLSS